MEGRRGRPEYDLVDNKKDLQPGPTRKDHITRCGQLVMLLACASSILIGTSIGVHIKYVESLGYLKAKPESSSGRSFQTNFLVVGDWGVDPEKGAADADTRAEVAREMAYVGAILRPDFVVSTGDHVFHGLSSKTDPVFNETFTQVYPEYPSLQVDWYSVLGEHDYGFGNDNANGLKESSPLYQMTSYNAENLPGNWVCCGGRPEGFSVKQHENLDLYFLDTGERGEAHFFLEFFLTLFPPPAPFVHKYYGKPWSDFEGGITSQKARVQAQVDALEGHLEQSSARWKVVVGHHPVLSNGLKGDTPELQRLRSIFKRHGVDLYLSGHDYTLQDIQDEEKPGLHYVTSGSGGAAQDEKKGLCCNKVRYFGAVPGFVAVSVSSFEARVQFWGRKATLLHELELKRT